MAGPPLNGVIHPIYASTNTVSIQAGGPGHNCVRGMEWGRINVRSYLGYYKLTARPNGPL